MHTLHLLRHAKSSWKEDLDDHDRPLSRRGRETARHLGRLLPAATGRLDLVVCSTARRARETLDLVLSGYAPAPKCLIEDGLYLASAARLLARLKRLDDADDNVLVIGHNPGLHELAVALADAGSPAGRALVLGKFPTAARASLAIAAPWAALGDRQWPLLDYLPPAVFEED